MFKFDYEGKSEEKKELRNDLRKFDRRSEWTEEKSYTYKESESDDYDYDYRRRHCRCHDHHDCKKLLKKFHELYREATELYNESNEITDKVVIEGIISAIKGIEESFDIAYKAGMLIDKADEMLENSRCKFDYKKDCHKCEVLSKKAMEQFLIERELLTRALNSLKNALTDVKNSVYARKNGQKYIDQYIECIHSKR